MPALVAILLLVARLIPILGRLLLSVGFVLGAVMGAMLVTPGMPDIELRMVVLGALGAIVGAVPGVLLILLGRAIDGK